MLYFSSERRMVITLHTAPNKKGDWFMAQITVTNLTFGYEGSPDNVFEGLSFQIDTDWKIGFIGRNGKGKTTFLKLLLGKYEYSGSITSVSKFDYFPYDIGGVDRKKLTIDVLEVLEPDHEHWKVCRELNLMDCDAQCLYRSFETLSNGEQTKVMLALLFSKENHFLLIDEPTNHLDMETRKLVKNYLNKKKGFILVSHDRAFLDGCIDHVLSFNRESVEIQQGNFSSWWENKKRRDTFEQNENEKLKREIKSLQESARRTSQWADKAEQTKIGFNPIKSDRNISTRAYIGEKSRRMQQRRKNLERRRNEAIDEKEGLLKDIEEAEQLKLESLKFHKEVLVRAKELVLLYDSKELFLPVDFEIKNNNIMAFNGKNGSGKSSILKQIMGAEIESLGVLEVASGLVISYVPQDTSFLCGSLREFIRESGISESLIKAVLHKLDFERAQFDKRIEDYSEGQKKKVLLARSLCTPAHLYIWDEPLNYIDVFSRMQLEDLVKRLHPTLLLVEHDRTFLENVGAKIIGVSSKC